MFHEPATPKIISVIIFWSFFILIVGFSILSMAREKASRTLRYARVCSRSYRHRH